MAAPNATLLKHTNFNQAFVWLSFSLLLYVLGMLGLAGKYAQNYLIQLRESVSFYAELKEEAKQVDIFNFQKELEAHQAVQEGSVQYIDKSEALKNWDEAGTAITKEELLIAGQNPLPNVLLWSLAGNYQDDLDSLLYSWRKEAVIREFAYNEVPLSKWQRKIYQVETLLLLLTLLFILLIYVLLKNNAKLALLQLKTLQDSSFQKLQEQYQSQSWRRGLWSAIVAIVGLWTTRIWLEHDWENLNPIQLEFWTSLISAMLLLAGLFLPWFAAKIKINE